MTEPSPDLVLDLIEAFRRSKTMFTAVSLGVFDRLEERPAGAAELSNGADAGAMERLLDACVSLGLLRKSGGRYENTPVASAYLRRSSERTLTGYILYSDRVLFRLWANLEDAVREGANRWEQTFGFRGDLFGNFFRTEEAQRDFLLGMHGVGLLSSPAVVAAFDLGAFRRLVDLGGATGHLAAAARQRYPSLEAVVFDLPSAVEFARRHVPLDGVGYAAGDFFRDPLPEADLFALGRILHDWTEDKIHALLARIHERLPEGGGVLIAEKLLDDDKSGPAPAHMQSLNMLVCAEGRERTLAEYEALLAAAGFRRVEGRKTGTPLDAVLARK
ncbi:MAG: homocysteine methyltransferase [Bryobacteraceae bacterium]|nr:homocysteine methyltransferase [Bryobacteraceae bacterium]